MEMSATGAASATSSNAHIFGFLDDFIESPNVLRSAVLINGAWGVGKSFAVNGYIEEQMGRGKNIVYVSLYGVKTADDIDTLMVTGAYSLMDSTFAVYGLRLMKTFVKGKLGTDVKISEILPKLKDIDLVVFDDFERSIMRPGEVLGYINSFVEHDGLRVLVVCNEAEVKGKAYLRIREKVVGTVFDFQLEERPALAAFIERIPDPAAQGFLKAHFEDAISIFQQSETRNLRLLQQTVWAWARLYKHIAEEFRDRERGMTAAFRLFMALSIELKAGRISRDDLVDRLNRIVAGRPRKDTKPEVSPALWQAQERYKLLYLHDSVLSDDVLEQVLCEGRHDPEAINASLGQSEYFLKPEDEPAWQKVWHGFTRPPEEFEAATKAMEEEFAAHKFLFGREILHVLSLRLWCARIGQLNKTEEEVVSEGRAYIDHLFARDMLLPGFDVSSTSHPMTGAYGLGFQDKDRPAFRELSEYYVERGKEALAASMPHKLEKLLDLMASDTHAFFSAIAWTNDDRPNTYAGVPIFATADADKFMKRMLACHPEHQRTILYALSGRYEGGRLGDDLKVERDWFVAVHDLLLAYAADPSTPPIRRYAIRSDVGRLLTPVLKRGSPEP